LLEWLSPLSLLGIFNIICILSVVFIERRRPQDTIAWIIVLTMLPYVGMVFYLLIGSSGTLMRLTRRRMLRKSALFNDYVRVLYSQFRLSREGGIAFNDLDMAKHNDMVSLLLAQNGAIYSQDNNIRIFTDANEKYDALFDDISRAKRSINIEYFIIRDDETGRRLVQLLAAKARQGVEVRLLYDPFGSIMTRMHMFAPIKRAGGRVCRYFGSIWANIIRINNRNHRKIVVIDGEIAYTGGMNIGDEYAGRDRRLSPWRDTHLRITGSSVAMLQLVFLADWSYSSKEEPDFSRSDVLNRFFSEPVDAGEYGVQIVSSGLDSGGDFVKYGYIKMINSAKKRLYIQTPYLIPDGVTLDALRLCAASGVDVRVMIPAKPDKHIIYAITRSYVAELLDMGVRVYAHEGFIHAKTVVIDGEVSSVGTTNFDMRSFSINSEVNAFVYSRRFARSMERIFEADIEHSREIDAQSFRRRSIFSKIWESLCRLIAPLG